MASKPARPKTRKPASGHTSASSSPVAPAEPLALPAPPQPPSGQGIQQLRGALRLATDGTLALAALVEAMHARIASPPGLRGPERTRGLTRLVYGAVQGTTRLVGGGVDGLMGALQALAADLEVTEAADGSAPNGSPANDTRQALIAALNGVLGDHLAASGNPLATPMTLQHKGHTLPLTDGAALAAAAPKLAKGRVLVLLHGLCMSPAQWLREGHDHGAALAQQAGFTPIYLHYNSGLPIHANGAAFAQQMAALMQALQAVWPQPPQRVVLLGHSMGGLVARSALHQGAANGQAWVQQVDDAVFLGSPHHGAPLERAGHWLDLLLGAAPYAAPLARLGRVRSAGITDLRHGRLLPGPATGAPVHAPLPTNIRCYAVAGSTGELGDGMKNRLLGDGLVPMASALGRHADPQRTLVFAPQRQLQVAHTHHMALLSSPEVAAALLRWLG